MAEGKGMGHADILNTIRMPVEVNFQAVSWRQHELTTAVTQLLKLGVAQGVSRNKSYTWNK